MKEETFFKHFRNRVKQGHQFVVKKNGLVREKCTGHCPITSVCESLHNKRYRPIGQTDYAIDKLKLEHPLSRDIQYAADESDKYLSGEVKRLRKRILKICGLKEVDS